MLWFGLLVAAIGGALLYFASRAADRVLHMKATDTSQIGTLKQLVDDVRKELGGGPSELREFVELKGVVACDHPLMAEMSGQPAAVVRSSVSRQIEELREERDSEGNTSTRWVSRTETVNNTSLDTPFWLDDGTGRIEVRPGGAKFTLQQVVDRFEPPASVERGTSITFGSFSFATAGMLGPSSRYRVKGYKFSEEILPIGQRVYALGEVSDTDDGFALHRSQDKDKPFVLSVKSEQEMVDAGMSQAKWMRYGGFGGIGLGVILALVGLVKMVAG